MAKVKLNPTLQSIHGKLEGFVFRRTPRGETTLIKLADMSRVQWSTAQKASRQRFKEAVAYAKAALADPAIRAQYEQAATQVNRRPYHLAITDYLKGNDLLKQKS